MTRNHDCLDRYDHDRRVITDHRWNGQPLPIKYMRQQLHAVCLRHVLYYICRSDPVSGTPAEHLQCSCITV